MEKAHLAFVNLYYDKLITDINNFIDIVYLPYQVRSTLNDTTTIDYLISTNIAQAELKQHIKELGDVAVSIAKKIPGLAALLA